MKRPPSDFELLRAIYERHRGDFRGASSTTGAAVAIDLPAIAESLGTTPETVWGRLYHHLDRVYGEEKSAAGSSRKALFIPGGAGGNDRINFPLLEAALAGLWQERNRQLWAVWASAISVAIAIAALIVSIVTAA